MLLLFIFGAGDVVMLDCDEWPSDVVSDVVLLLADDVERPMRCWVTKWWCAGVLLLADDVERPT